MNKRKAFFIAIGIHVCALGVLSVTSLSSETNEKNTHKIEENSAQIKAKSVNSAELDEIMDTFRTERANSLAREQQLKSQLNQAEKELKNKLMKVREAERDLKNINSEVRHKERELVDLKKKSNDNRLKQKQLEDKRKQEAEQKARLHEEKRQAERLKKAKLENQKLIERLKQEEIKKEEERVALLRGVYERTIHDRIEENWISPLKRENVRCKVLIKMDKSGIIMSHKFVSPCPLDYKNSIANAITQTAILPKVDSAAFKEFEEVNFFDNVNGFEVRGL